jgi:Leucine-rich repeat (LRR) protein
MNRFASDSTNPSSTTSNAKQLSANIPLSDITSVTTASDTAHQSKASALGTNLFDFTNQHHDGSAVASNHEQDHSIQSDDLMNLQVPTKYTRNLRYLANNDFLGDFTKVTQVNSMNSVTNTFNYKSHPNAKTKSSLTINDENHPLHSLHEDEELPPVQTSTVLLSSSNDDNAQNTPDWIPKELDTKWNSEEIDENLDFMSSVRINKQATSQQNNVELEFPSTSNTMIHNKNNHNKQTPMWQRVQKLSQPNFHDIFLSQSERDVFESHRGDVNRSQSQNHSLSSTMSTPFGTMKGNKQNLEYNTNLTKTEKRTVAGNPESPLKLFADNYNTYTKEKLNGVLKKVNDNRSAQQTPQAMTNKHSSNPSLQQLPQPRIHEFTKTNGYTDQQFIQNANQIFNQIQRKGFKIPDDLNRNTTATSTPKPNKILYPNQPKNHILDKDSTKTDDITSDDYTSYESNDEDEGEENQPEYDSYRHQTQNDYTSFDHSSRQIPSAEISHSRTDSEFTFDEISSDDNGVSHPARQGQHREQYYKSENDTTNRVSHQLSSQVDVHENDEDQFEYTSQSLTLSENRQEDQDEMNEIHKKVDQETTGSKANKPENSFFNSTTNSIPEFNIKLKHASQLRLNEAKVLRDRDLNSQSITRGRVRPDAALPHEYGNMVLDEKNQRWIKMQDKENAHGSLDSIEDLEISNDHKYQNKSFKKDGKSKMEVSFDLKNERSPDVTKISDLNDVTFSQSQKRLVAVITDVLANSDHFQHKWNQIKEIVLSGYQLQNIKDLNKILPNLTNVDLSRNFIQYLDGLPKNLLSLDLSENSIDDMTSFGQFHDLQYLNLSTNHLVNLSNIRNSIHLSELNLSNNELANLNGIEKLINLTKLNLSQNKLIGELDFSKSELPHLEVLNLSENNIQSVLGIENLPELRVLDLTENQLIQISCSYKHKSLKKLVLKLNNLKRLNLEPFPNLRVLRVDGNSLNVLTDINRLKHLQELSVKCQSNTNIVDNIMQNSTILQTLDLSGNIRFDLAGFANRTSEIQSRTYFSLTKLVLTAMNLTALPPSFSNLYPNIRELNLNFNRIHNLNGLSQLTNLRKLYLVSNSITRTEIVITGLSGSRNTLKVLDLRLNPCNVELYPYVFNPTELDLARKGDIPVHLDTLDEIEYFSIYYEALNKTTEEWEERDGEIVHRIAGDKRGLLRNQYELLFINYFHNIVQLDGTIVSENKRNQLKSMLRQEI